MKIAALDYGERHIGVALTDDDGALALRHDTVSVDGENIFESIRRIVQIEVVDLVLVGIPRNLDGEETQQSQKIRAFVVELQEQLTDVEVQTIDETLTSVEAEENLKREGVSMGEVHAEAARIMLEDYLRQH